jgi:plasmid maintenance system antidote protein VapI
MTAVTMNTGKLPAHKLLRDAEISQWDVARAAGVSAATVNNVLHGRYHHAATEAVIRSQFPLLSDKALFGEDRTAP